MPLINQILLKSESNNYAIKGSVISLLKQDKYKTEKLQIMTRLILFLMNFFVY